MPRSVGGWRCSTSPNWSCRGTTKSSIGPEDQAEYYKVHISLVPPRAKREWQLIARRIPDVQFQNAFLTSLSQHFRVERAYYDAIWEEMQSVK